MKKMNQLKQSVKRPLIWGMLWVATKKIEEEGSWCGFCMVKAEILKMKHASTIKEIKTGVILQS